MKRLLILVHRWTGIALGLFFAMWFVSGVIMIYVPFPHLTEAERRERLQPLALDAVRVAAQQAVTTAGLEGMPVALRLGMLLDRPVYRLLGRDGSWRSVFADDGRALRSVDAGTAEAVAGRFARAPVLGSESIGNDQWTVAQGLDAHRPLYKIRIDDAEASVLYVSSRTGEVVRDTTRSERFWNWLGSVPHWIYPTLLRERTEIWRHTVTWLSALGVVAALTGLVVGLWRFRWRRPAPEQPCSPYRGWTKWHHWLGLVCSLFVATWIISGFVSMNPGRVFSDRSPSRAALESFAGGGIGAFALAPGAALASRSLPFEAREIELALVAGDPWYVVYGAPGESRLVRALESASAPLALLDQHTLAAAAVALQPNSRLVSAEWLTAYDTYWYSRRGTRPLPVLRVAFDDPDRTWYHLDPARARVLDRMDDSRRAYRWWFNALHSLDFPWLIARRPLWDIVVITLCAGGFALSVTGVVVGWRRLRGSVADITGRSRRRTRTP